MALAEGILAVALEAGGGERVRRVQVRIGRLQAVEPDSLEFSFRLAAEQTAAADAVVEMKEVPVTAACGRCHAEQTVEGPALVCRECGAPELEIRTGNEVLVDAVEVDSGWRRRPES